MNNHIIEFTSIYTGSEEFLIDHQVQGIKTLPGVAYLELARSGGCLALDKVITGISDIVWLRPIQVTDKAVEITTSYLLDEHGAKFEISSITNGTKQIHSQGKLSTGSISAGIKHDLSEIRQQCGKKIMREECYAEFNQRGLNYGVGFQGIQEMYYSHTEALSRISLNSNSAYTLAPGVLDSALQSCMGIDFKTNNQALELPFSIKELNILGSLPDYLWCYVRLSNSESKLKEYNLDLCDDDGNVLVQIKGFVAISISGGTLNKNEASVNYYTSEWKAVEKTESKTIISEKDQLVILDSTTEFCEQISKAENWKVEHLETTDPQSLFTYFKEKIVTAIKEKALLNLTIVGAFSNYSNYGFIRGLIKTAEQEYPQFQGRLVALEKETMSDLDLFLNRLTSEVNSSEKEIKYSSANRFVRSITSIEPNATQTNALELKPNGVYLITGGFGGLGLEFAHHIATKCGATIILSGRSELTTEKQNLLKTIPNAFYLSADVTKATEVARLMNKIKTDHGQLKGILHGAGVLRDSFLIHKTDEDITAVFAPKIEGIKNLDEATKNEDLDFIFCFSSVSSILGNIGQSDYASANAFMDDFVSYRNALLNKGERRGLTLSINWPLWRSGGMQIDASSEQYLKRHWGMQPLPTVEGLNAFDTILKNIITNVLVLYGNKNKIESVVKIHQNEIKETIQSKNNTIMDIEKLQTILITICADLLKLDVSDIDSETELSEYGLDSILMMKLLSVLEIRFDIVLDPTVLIQHPTIFDLAVHLNEGKQIFETSNLSEMSNNEPVALIDTQSSIRQEKKNKKEQIHNKVAIIGMSCKLPESDDIHEFWSNLRAGKELIKNVPEKRWGNSDFYSENFGNNTAYTQKGGFLKNPGLFDAPYFKIKDDEAISIDPQQRIALELVRDLIANAGYEKEEFAGSDTGIFLGAKDNNYVKNGYEYLPEGTHNHVIVNNISNMIAARISDFYDLKGVSQIVDTACSSSLVAIHQACEAILADKMDMAIAGGISIMVDAYGHIGFSQAKVLSKEGKSYVFDERADGFVMGEGGGLILLKNYEKAVADGDNIIGFIAGSAINNDGRTMGLTVPNKNGQKEVIAEALNKSGFSADQISYFEAHGTGTLLGDPIEVNAASEVYQEQTKKTGFCAIGSVKSNVGHTMTAAGITGVIKILLQLQHREIVPTINCEKPHPRFKFDTSPFYPITKNKAWETSSNIAAISSFGFGGTNCHMIIEDGKKYQKNVKRSPKVIEKKLQNYYWLGHDIIIENCKDADKKTLGPSIVSPTGFKNKVIRLLQTKIAEKQGVEPEDILIDEGFMDLGLDSTVLIQMTTDLGDELKVDLYPTLLFQYDNIQKLSSYLVEEHLLSLQSLVETDIVVENELPESVITPEKEVEKRNESNYNKDEIAIVGISGRLPGSNSLDEFWQNIYDNKDVITEIPKDRWDWKEYYGDEKIERGKTKSKYGGFIKDIDKFDRRFFRILPLESQLMDPQHRIALEEVYHLFEDAGIAPEGVKGTDTGVFVGVSSADYGSLIAKEEGLKNYAQYATGNSHGVLANRISYLFDLHGPSQPIDTACSSSLIAIHRAVENIRAGNCEMAIAGGVNIIASPDLSLSFSQAGMLSEDGRCKTFDQKANGYVRSEGIGFILLKPLSKAEADGDHIYGIIKGSSENHGGKVNTLTSPNPNAQRDVIVRAYKNANINPLDISYIEAHGTGTPLGDPIETEALKMAFNQLGYDDEMNEKKYCALGSVKANIGHLEAAAGIAGVLKVILCLKHQKLTGNPHLTVPNYLLKLENSPLRLLEESENWTTNNDRPRIAGISSFGFGGANAHVIIQEYTSEKKIDRAEGKVLICLSAKNEEILNSKKKDLLSFLKNNKAVNLDQLAYTLQVGRDRMECRATLITASLEDLMTQLGNDLDGSSSKIKTVASQKLGLEIDDCTSEKTLAAIETDNLEELANLWLVGATINWRSIYKENLPKKINIPLYPFSKERCWYDDLLNVENEHKKNKTKEMLSSLDKHIIGDEIGIENLENGIVIVKMQAKATKNMLNEQLIKSLEKTFLNLQERKDLKVVILTGYDNVFCMGGSQDVLAGIAENQQQYTDAPFVYKGLLEFKVPVITAIQGIAVGGGLVFGLYGDIVFMAENVTYSSNFMKYGFTPGMGATYIMPQKLGNQLAQEMMYSAKLIGGAELKARGAAVKITNDVLNEAIRMAKELAAKPKVALEVLKKKMAGRILNELDSHVQEELDMHSQTFHTEEVKNLIASHFEKNKLQNNEEHIKNNISAYGKLTLLAPSEIANRPSQKNNHNQKVSLSDLKNDISFTSKSQLVSKENISAKVTPLPSIINPDVEYNTYLIDPINLIKKCASTILNILIEELDEDETFIELGIDSISGVELIRSVNEAFELQLETVILYDYPTMNQLAKHIADKVPEKIKTSQKEAIVLEPVTYSKVVLSKQLTTSIDTNDSYYIEALKQVFEKVLNLPANEIDAQESFIGFGVDSINGVEVVRGINEKFNLSLEAVILYDYFNLEKLAKFIAEKNPNLKSNTTERVVLSDSHVQPVLSLVNKESIKFDESKSELTKASKATVKSTDIAIIGMSGKFPKATNVAEYWKNLTEGKNCVEEVPERKWSIDELFSEDRSLKGKTYGKWLGAIDDEDKFDAYFFNISPLEAKKMDPQQRVFLEEVWKTFEDAGYAGEHLSETTCGVFVGVGQGDYFDRFKENEHLDNHVLTGATTSILASRISYLLNLQGPAIAIDTACSSSLVAVHQACQSILSDDCEMAIAGGVNIMTTESMHIMTSKAEMLSADGKCYSFDNKANGFVPGEAVGAILLKPLEKAIEDGDHIYGVIKGSGINQDGKTNGIMAPSANSQKRLIERIYDKYQIDPHSISYIETHGTGTKLGDPIEIKALKEVFIKDENEKDSCALGSVKTNIGHGLTAAGISSLIKVLLSLKYKKIPASINFNNLNEHINLGDSPFYVNDKLKDWENKTDAPRRAAMSSFGYSGTNAHVVIEEYVQQKEEQKILQQETIFVFSAKNTTQLKEKATQFITFLENDSQSDLRSIAYTLLVGREEMNERLVIIAANKNQLKDTLKHYIQGQKGNYGTTNIRNVSSTLTSKISETNSVLNDAAEKWLMGQKLSVSILLMDEVKPKRISLPTYPFEKERFWFERVSTKGVKKKLTTDAVEWSFTKIINENETYLIDHKVNGKKIVPGVAYLQFVMDSIYSKSGQLVNQFKSVKLLAPVFVVDESVKINVKISQNENRFEYSITSIINGISELNAQGECWIEEEIKEKRINPEQLKSNFVNSVDKVQVYERFNTLGLNYGPSFRGIDKIWFNNKEALGFIHLPENATNSLFLGILDSCLQTCLGINFERLQLKLPYSIDRITLFEKFPSKIWSHAQKELDKHGKTVYNVKLYDEVGQCIADFKAVIVLPIPSVKKTNFEDIKEGKFLYIPKWKRIKKDGVSENKIEGLHLIVGGNSDRDLAEGLKEFLERKGAYVLEVDVLNEIPNDVKHIYILNGLLKNENQYESIESMEYAVFRGVKKIQNSSFNRKGAQLTVFTRNTQKVTTTDKIMFNGGGIVGIIGSLAKEQPTWNIGMIDLGDSSKISDWNLLLDQASNKKGAVVAYRNSFLFTSELLPWDAEKSIPSKIKKGGVYVLLGGAGGIGRVTSEYLIKKYNACIVWLGRRDKDEQMERYINEVSIGNNKPTYIQCDATKIEDLEIAYKKIKSIYPSLNGVFHSAIVLNDRLIKNMDENAFKIAFEPKSIATHNLFEVFKNEPLDFVCFYSSIQSQVNAVGQSNYSAGCTYKDSYAHALQQKRENTNIYTINWGYWGEVGIVSSKDYKEKLAASGLGSINATEGMQILEQVLSGEQKQLAAIKFIN